MIRTKQISHKICKKALKKNLALKINNSDKIKIKMLKKKSLKKCKIKFENTCELSAYYDLLISV